MFVIVPVRAMKLRSLLWLPVFYSAIFPLPAQTNNLPPHPRLLLNAAGVAELKQRITNTSWAKISWNELKERGDPAKVTTDFDGNAMMAKHLDYARQVVDDGLVYQVSGDARYA